MSNGSRDLDSKTNSVGFLVPCTCILDRWSETLGCLMDLTRCEWQRFENNRLSLGRSQRGAMNDKPAISGQVLR